MVSAPRPCSACAALKNIGLSHKCGGERCIFEIINTINARKGK